MAGQQALSPLISVQLNEKLIDGASLVHPTVEAHNCVQLRRWLKCHGRPQGGNKAELVERLG